MGHLRRMIMFNLTIAVSIGVIGCSQPASEFVTFRGQNVTSESWNDIRFFFGGKSESNVMKWDAAAPSMMRMILLGARPVTINLHCEVNRLVNDVLIYVEFCFQPHGHEIPQWCMTLNAKKRRDRIVINRPNKVIVDLTFDPQEGGVARLTNIPLKVSLDDLRFSCKAANRRGSRTSNSIQFFDYRSQFPTEVRSNNTEMNFIAEVSQRVQCLRSLRVNAYIIVPFEWKVCSNDSCQSVLELNDSAWPVQILRSGDLYWPYVTPKVRSYLQGKRLRCSVGGHILANYTHNLTFRKAESRPFNLVEPRRGERVFLFDSNLTDTTLRLEIDGLERPDWTWERNGKTMEPTTNPGNDTFSLLRSGLVRCRGPFSSGRNDLFSVDVIDTSRKRKRRIGRAAAKMRGSYTVITEGYPKPSPKMPEVIRVVNGSDAHLICRFEKPELVIPDITIIGISLDFDSQWSLARSVKEINYHYQSVMAPLNISFSLIRPKRGDTLGYTARNMVYRSRQHGNRSSSHFVECIGYRQGYSVRHGVVIKAVPRPEMAADGVPSYSQGPNSTKKTIRCRVENQEQIQREGAEVLLEWRVDNKKIEDNKAGGPFKFSKDKTELDVDLKVRSSESADLPQEKVVACIVKLRSSEGSGRFFYSSLNDPSLRNKLTTTIRLVPSARRSSLLFVIAIGVAAVILVTLFPVIIFYRRVKRKSPSENDIHLKIPLNSDEMGHIRPDLQSVTNQLHRSSGVQASI